MTVRKKRFRDWQEARRFRAIDLRRQGWKQVKIAEALGVTEGAVSQWTRLYDEFGNKALKGREKSGAPSRLSPHQINLIPEFLSHGAESYGFRGEIWTYSRVAHVIKQEFEVHYHPHHVARLMKILKWTPHKPVIRAEQRNEEEIEQWRTEVWPDLKKSQKRE